jgi:hypothetical protein
MSLIAGSFRYAPMPEDRVRLPARRCNAFRRADRIKVSRRVPI